MKKARPDALEDQRAAALTLSALECAKRLGLSPVETASLLGVPQGALAAMKKGERAVDGYSGEAERAGALVRIVGRLRTLLGDADTNWRSWIRRENADLDCKPVDLLLQREGIERVARHVERATAL